MIANYKEGQNNVELSSLYKTEHITPNYMYLLSVRVYDCIDNTIYQHAPSSINPVYVRRQLIDTLGNMNVFM